MLSKWNKNLLAALLIVGLAPSFVALIIAGSPLALVLLLFFGVAWLPRLIRAVLRAAAGVADAIVNLLGAFFRAVFGALGWLLGGARGPKPARFMGWFRRRRVLGGKGVLVDGDRARLSEKASYKGLIIQGGMGAGKSAGFVIPNLLMPPPSRPSFVITDTSGEIFAKTSGFLARKGWRIETLDLMQFDRSLRYNPLAFAQSPQEIAEIAHILIRAGSGRAAGGSDPFWEQSAEKLLRIMAQCLVNQNDPSFCNLANLRHLVTGFDAHTASNGQLGRIDQFVLSATQNDPVTFQDYRAFASGNLKTMQSILMSADVALSAVATPEMAALTASNDLDFQDLRRQPVALYVIVNQTQMAQYQFLLNIFYAQLFRALLQNEQDPGRPVWLMLDEFGHIEVNNFATIATTARKYRVMIALLVQSFAQLEARYGGAEARIIRDGLGAEMHFPGMALDQARDLEARLGRAAKGPLMAAHDIIRMRDDQALFLHGNDLPVLLRNRRYFQRADLRRRARIAPFSRQSKPTMRPALWPL